MQEHERSLEPGAGTCASGAVLSVPLTETSPGVYETYWTVPADLPAGVYDVVGCLTVAGEAKAATPPAVLIVQTPPPVVQGPGQPPPPSPPAPTPPSGTPTTPAIPGPALPPPPPAPPTIWVLPPIGPGGAVTAPGTVGPTDYFPTGQRVPPGHFWVTPDDFLVVGVKNAIAGTLLTVATRLWSPAGQAAGGSTVLTPPSDRSTNYYAIPLSYGYLCAAAVVSSGVALRRGQCLVSLRVARGPVAAFLTSLYLGEDYVTAQNAVCWWPGRVITGTEGPGALHGQAVSTPVAGAEWSIVVPTGVRWRVRMAEATLTTSAVAGNRFPGILVLDAGGNELQALENPNSLGPGVTGAIRFEPGGPVQVVQTISLYLPLFTDFQVPQVVTIRSFTTGLKSGDQYSGVLLYVEEWLDE